MEYDIIFWKDPMYASRKHHLTIQPNQDFWRGSRENKAPLNLEDGRFLTENPQTLKRFLIN